MAKATVHFREMVQDSQDFGSNDEHMVSRVFFDLEFEGKMHTDLQADLKQAVGSSYESGAVEVSRPLGYKGPFNAQAFQQAAESYYRSLVGAKAKGIRIVGAANVRMRNNKFIQPAAFEIEIDPASGGTW